MQKPRYYDPNSIEAREILPKILKAPVRESQTYWRERQARWDAAELRTASTKVRREVYERFQELCHTAEKTPYSVLKALLLDWMRRQ